MFRSEVIISFVLLAGFAVYVWGTEARCCGAYDLTVAVDPEIATKVSSVSYFRVHHLSMAEYAVERLDEYLPDMLQRPAVTPFSVKVGLSYRTNGLGMTWGDIQQYSHLVVVLHHADGMRATYILEIPHRDDSRKITVTAANAA